MAKRGINKHQKKAVEMIMSDGKARTAREILDCWPKSTTSRNNGKSMNRPTTGELKNYLGATRKDDYLNITKNKMLYFIDDIGELRMWKGDARYYQLKK